MMQQAYATALWYLSCVMPVSHTDKNSSEAVPGNESSTTIASFGQSKHAHSLETAKDCLAIVINNSADSSVTVELSASGSVIAQRSASALVSAITELFGNDSKHTSSSETAKDCSTTVSGKNRASSATKISTHSINQVVRVRQANASWKTTLYFVLVTTLLTSFSLKVQGHFPGITNEDSTDTGANTEQWEDFRTGTA